MTGIFVILLSQDDFENDWLEKKVIKIHFLKSLQWQSYAGVFRNFTVFTGNICVGVYF